MKVKDLIVRLNEFDPETEVMLDVAHPDSAIFRFASLASCAEIGVETKGNIVALSPPHSILSDINEQ